MEKPDLKRLLKLGHLQTQRGHRQQKSFAPDLEAAAFGYGPEIIELVIVDRDHLGKSSVGAAYIILLYKTHYIKLSI
jgi:hypothetical protein